MSASGEPSRCQYIQTPVVPVKWVPSTTNSSSYRLLMSQTVSYSSQKTVSDLQSSRRVNKMSKPSSKHVPHKDKAPQLVARRNARERKRVQAVNSAFAILRKCVPIENRNKRISKVKTLHRAIEYINSLQDLLRQSDNLDLLQKNPIYYRSKSECHSSHDDYEKRNGEGLQELEEYLESDTEIVNKENESQRWSSFSSGCESSYWNCNEDCSGSSKIKPEEWFLCY